MPDQRPADLRSDIFFMLVSAGIFAYFGFGTQWIHTSAATGQTLLFVVLLDYTLKAAAVGMGLSAILIFINRYSGSLLYAIVGLLSAIMFAVIAVLDLRDTQHTALSPVLLFVFAAWNGYGSIAALASLFVCTRAPAVDRLDSREDR